MFKYSSVRTGVMWSVLLGWFSLCAVAKAAPVNDQFSAAIAITGSIIVTGSNVTATTESGEPLHAGNTGGKSVWWNWTPTHSGLVTVSTLGSGFDTLLAVYTGSSVGSLVNVASNDDASLSETTSRLTFSAVLGTTYRIAVDGILLEESETDEGPIQLIVLDNDRFQDRIVLAGNNLFVDSHNVEATSEAGEPSHTGQPPSRSVWWSWTAPGNGQLSLALSGDNTNGSSGMFYKLLAVYTGNAVGSLTSVASHGNPFTLTNRLSFNVISGVTYQIAADGVGGAAGRLRLGLSFALAPSNDAFANRQQVVGNDTTVTGSNAGASKEAGEPNHAGQSGGRSVWCSWTAPGNGTATFSLSGGIATKLLAIYTGGTLASLTEVVSNADASATNQVSIDVMGGTTYQIAVDGAGGETGAIALNVRFAMTGANDFFANRIFLGGTDLTVTGSNVGATAEANEPDHGGYPASRSVWWSWMAPANGTVMITVMGDNLSSGGNPFYKLIGIYSGTALGALTTNKLSSGLTLTNRVTTDVVAGSAYQIAVDGHNGASGSFSFILKFTPAPANDDFANRLPLTGGTVMTSGSNVAASKELGEPTHAVPGGRSVWWTWTAPINGNVTISTAGSSFNTLLAVYQGSAVGSLSPVASNNDFGGGQTSQVTFNAVAGMSYEIAVDGLVQASGAIQLTINQPRPMPSLGRPRYDGTFQFSFAAPLNARYSVEATTNFQAWVPVGLVTNTTGTIQFTDPNASTFRYRFYRVREQ